MKQDNLNRRSFLCALAALAPAVSAARSAAAGTGGAHRVEAMSHRGPRIELEGHFGYRQYQARNLPPHTLIEAVRASFSIANSRNANPTAGADCEVGHLPVNAYPVVIRNSPGVRFVGGRFDGEVPLSSDWRDTYCNSAALLLRDGSTAPEVESIRVRRCWDGVRFAKGAHDFRLRGCWLSDVRDDAVENDYLYDGTIEDCLFDGCFSGISLDPASRDSDGSRRVLTVDRCLIRMQTFPTEDGMNHGSPFKMTDVSPLLRLSNTVLALSADKMRFRRLERTWRKMIENRNNTLLWLSDSPIPSGFPFPPEGFQVVSGKAARRQWAHARQLWIDGHPRLKRFHEDI